MRQPNLLFICSDQHTPRVLGCYGDPVVETPNLDALAAEGTRFDGFYCNNPICCPSRMSFVSGRYSYKVGCLDNQSVLDSRTPTLAHMAVRAGYHAVLSGKMHFNGPDLRHGFLERLVGEGGGQSLHNGANGSAPGLKNLGNCSRPEPLQFTGPGHSSMVALDADITGSCKPDWLEEWGKRKNAPPFFMIAGLNLPHCPFIAPGEVYRKYAGKVKAPRLTRAQLDALHPHHRDYRRYIELDAIPADNQDRAVVAYYALTELLDRNVGLLLGALKASGLWENTIVVYTSDHGEMLGHHGRWHKEAFYEDAARVPLIIRHPAGRKAESTGNLHSLVDLMPTFCDWMGVEPPPGIDGVSMLPSLEGKVLPDQCVKAETYTHWTEDQHGMSANRMVRKGPWKLCYYGAYDSCQLFNLEEDPEENDDRTGDDSCAAVIGELKAELFSGGWSRNIVQEVRQELNRDGGWDNIKAYRDALRKGMNEHPRHVDHLDLWSKAWTEAATLDG